MSAARWGTLVRPLARAADAVLDPSIVFSFDQTGYLRHRTQFDDSDLDVDMTGRLCLVTGGNSGLGLATARGLASRGATVWILGRNEVRSAGVCEKLRSETGNSNISHFQLDLGDPESVDRVVRAVGDQPVDVLVNNAGVLLNERGESEGGLELTLATNLVGHLRLTAGLLPALRAGDRARIVWVSSGGMYAKRLSVDDLRSPPEPFDGVAAYAQTKRAMVTISRWLADSLASTGIAVHAMHPGWAATPGVEQSLPTFWKLTRPILRTAETGADTILWLAVCDKAHAESGRFWFDRKIRSEHLLGRTRQSQEEERRLWDELHDWAGLSDSVWADAGA